MSVFALIDANNFFASCERVFSPSLNKKPIVVLSNNDGCIIARSNESKNLGIPMGVPYYQWRIHCQKNKVHVFSSNFELYGDLSTRLMSLLSGFCPSLEVYSIDEAFLMFHEKQFADLMLSLLALRSHVLQCLGLPVCIGIASTKTLAKIANHIAKKKTLNGVFDLRDPAVQENVLEEFPIEDIWGIGRQLSKKLKAKAIHTAKQLRDSNISSMRRQFGVVMERIIQELRGSSCLPLETMQPRKQIRYSRSFGKTVTCLTELEEALSHYAAKACSKLRKQKSVANGLCVFLQMQDFTRGTSPSRNALSAHFPQPSSDTPTIIQQAKKCLRILYKQAVPYKKVGILLLDLMPEEIEQFDLFADSLSDKKKSLAKTVDAINEQLGNKTVFYAAEGIGRQWQMKCGKRSPRYSTRWKELVVVKND